MYYCHSLSNLRAKRSITNITIKLAVVHRHRNKSRVYLFQWDKQSAQLRGGELHAAGWTVKVEREYGARGGKAVLKSIPDAVVFDLAKRPLHSRKTAGGICDYTSGRFVPFVLVDGSEEDIAKTKSKVSEAQITSSGKLLSELNSILKQKQQASA